MNDTPDLQAVTKVQQQTWSEGDFAMVANLVYPVSEFLVEDLDIFPDERVLDVASGSGNAAIAAARRAWGNTVSSDFVPALLEHGRQRAAADGLEIEFVEADAQELPFGDASFDVTISVFGAMFAPDQEKTAAELLRVTKPGGRIGMANWTPDGGIAQIFLVMMKHTGGPPPGVMPPVLWGVEDRVRELFGDGITDLRVEVKPSRQAFRSADHYIEFFRKYFGPVKTAYDKVGPEGEGALTADLKSFLEEANVGGDRALVIEPEYAQVIATRT